MKIIENIKTFFTRGKINPLDSRYWTDIFSVSTESGMSISEESSVRLAAVFACVKAISDTIATLPFSVYRPEKNGKVKLTDHKLNRIFNRAPNRFMNAFEFKRLMQVHINLWGNFYAEIEYNGRGDVIGLWPIMPSRVSKVYIDEKTLQKVFEINVKGKTIKLTQEKVFHIPGLSYDGVTGISVIRNFKENIGTGMAMEKFSSRFFGSGTHLGGVAEVPQTMSDVAYDRFKKSVNENYKGIENSHKVMILEEGAKFQQLGIPPGDAQFIEQRKFSREEICSIFGVPQHMIGILDKATYNNLEQQNNHFAQFTIAPRITNIETHINWRLFPENSKNYVKFNIDALLRGDSKSRSDFYRTGRQWGYLSVNDIRELEDMEPVEGGDRYLQPLNMVDIKTQEGAVTQVAHKNTTVEDDKNA